jgi:hypothetical protein
MHRHRSADVFTAGQWPPATTSGRRGAGRGFGVRVRHARIIKRSFKIKGYRSTATPSVIPALRRDPPCRRTVPRWRRASGTTALATAWWTPAQEAGVTTESVAKGAPPNEKGG